MSAALAPPWISVRLPVVVSLPTTAKSSSYFSKMRRATSSRPGLRTMSMRSWLSDSMIS